MKFRRFLASLMAVVMLTTTMMAGVVTVQAAPRSSDDAEKYVTLDGEWSFKLYRTYSQMYQYFPYVPALSLGNWTDAEAAVYPEDGAWKDWDTIQMPFDNPETGGLLTNEISPMWSEAWVVREFDLPADFTDDDTVTLLLGVVDDNDVVYINGTAVASSGFVDGNGSPVLDVPATGGFDYMAAAPEDQVKWKMSYYQVSREYEIPSDVLNLGGTNEIAVRLYNNNSNGGFYAGNPYAICGNDLAVRNLKGLATEVAESSEVEEAVATQIAALAAGDVDAYAETISDNYHNDAADKDAKVAEIESLLSTYDNVYVIDSDTAIYTDDDGYYWYSAERTTDGGASTPVELCFEVVDGVAYERGNWNRCYGTSYSSDLFGQDLTYSVYLPPSYYENEDTEYPVVWLLHGRASSSESYRNVDKIGAFMDEQIESGEIVEMILVMPDSGKYAFYQDSELTPGDKDNSGPWRTQLVEELREVADSTYRTIDDAKFRGLTGNSMGGYGAMSVGTSYPDVYSSVGVHMGYLPTDALECLQSLTADQLTDYDFYLDCGLQDTTVGTAGTIAVHDYLVSVDKEHGYELRDGIHGSAFYMAGMPASMKMHSDHFLANGLFEAELTSARKIFDLADPSDVQFRIDLNGNVIESVNLPDDAYVIDDDCVIISADYLCSKGSDSLSVSITLKSGQVLTGKINIRLSSGADKEDSDPVTPSTPTPVKPAYQNPFYDVSDRDYFAKAVQWAVENNITSGTTSITFGPNEQCTRGQLVTFLYKMAGSPAVKGSAAPFADVAESAYYADAVRWAAKNDIVSGYGNNSFGPADVITREQLATILFNYAKFNGYDVSEGENTNILSYGDAFSISEWAIPAIQWACGAGVMSGNPDGTLNPVGTATRAHVVQMLMNFSENAAN